MQNHSDQPEVRDTAAIVYFDGVCGFCNHTVNFLMARDPQQRLRFAPLQGATAAARLPDTLRASLNTLVFQRGGSSYVRSAAVVRILLTLGGVWAVAGVLLWLVPLPLRDLGYRCFARVRYRLFGKHDACRLPSPAERGLILE